MNRIFKILISVFVLVFLAFFFVLPHRNLPNISIGEGDGSVCVYYINLDKATDRKEALLPLLKKLEIPFERIPAIYGKDLPEEEKSKLANKWIFRMLMQKDIMDGEIGCYMSHLKTWQEFLGSKHSYALILEDDVSFNPKELKELINLLVSSNDKWDCVNIDPHRPGNPKIIKKLSEKFNLTVPKQRVWLADCYLINRKAAASLVKHALPIRMPVDHYINRSWELGYKFRCIDPKIVSQTFGDTYIQFSNGQEKGYLYIPQHMFRIATQLATILMTYLTER